MSERPLLLLPTPEATTKSNLSGGSGRPNLPTHARQGNRLAPIFTHLQQAVRARNIEIQQAVVGIDPEQVLVMDIIGSVENFATAVKRIEGLEWLAELEVDEVVPDQDFFDAKDPEKKLDGRLYMVMTNQNALDQMLSMWRRYADQDDPKQKFAHGLTKFRDVFRRLKEIRRWDVSDRLQETGVLDAWREDLEHDGGRFVRFEVELWYRNSEEKRLQGSKSVESLVQGLGGRILSESLHESIAYHAVLAELPAYAIQNIIDNPNTELVKCDSVMFFRPVGQMIAGDGSIEGEAVVYSEFEEHPLPEGEPIVAVFDGLPLANHRLLNGRLIIDDPDNVGSKYEANERVHGTSMVSLIVHGDLNYGSQPMGRPVYVRPIMQPVQNSSKSPRPEHVPDHLLLVDLIHRAVKRLFEVNGTEHPVAPSIRVINLSIGDPSRQFLNTMSPVARMLDWLSFTHGILFIVSAGNHTSPIHLEISRAEFESLDSQGREDAVVRALFPDARNRRILSPAESINGLTVGSVQSDSSCFANTIYRFNPFQQQLPSPVSAFGSGYRNGIKPDIVFPGGRVLYEEDLSRSRHDAFVIKPVVPSVRNTAPGNRTANSSAKPGDLKGTAFSCGTSNAAALVSRAAGICQESLQQIIADQASDEEIRSCEAALLKAMLVHGCAWGDVGIQVSELLRTSVNSRKISSLVSRWMGYGVPEIDRVLDCTEQRATMFGYGQLFDGKAHVYRIPLPPSLGARPEWRRLVVTMAWLSPISPRTQRYRTSSLWFEVDGIELAKDRKESCSGTDGWRAVRRGTVQHEVFEGDKAVPFIDGDVIEVKVNCRKDAGKIEVPVPYGLIVSLEVAEGVELPIYNEIRTRITPAIKIQ